MSLRSSTRNHDTSPSAVDHADMSCQCVLAVSSDQGWRAISAAPEQCLPIGTYVSIFRHDKHIVEKRVDWLHQCLRCAQEVCY